MNGHGAAPTDDGAYVAYSNIERNRQERRCDGNSNLFLVAAIPPDHDAQNVVELRRLGDVWTHHPQQKPALDVVKVAPEIQKGKFVGVINEVRDAWRAGRPTRRP